MIIKENIQNIVILCTEQSDLEIDNFLNIRLKCWSKSNHFGVLQASKYKGANIYIICSKFLHGEFIVLYFGSSH